MDSDRTEINLLFFNFDIYLKNSNSSRYSTTWKGIYNFPFLHLGVSLLSSKIHNFTHTIIIHYDFLFSPMLILIIWRFMTSLRSFQFLSFNTKLSFSALKLPEATTPFFILIEQMQKVVQNQVHLYTNSLVCTRHTCFSKEYFWEIRASRPLTLCASNTYHPNLLCLR